MKTSPLATATATETSSTPSMNAVETAQPTLDADGICDDVDPCVGALDACGVCNGPGDIYECGCEDIPTGDCDCDGNQLDALDECGGDCAADADDDGICDDVDPAWEPRRLRICNGPGDIYECGCEDIPTGDCDCDGNQLDALDECGGDCAADADADGICDDVDPCVGALDACGVCNGPGDIYECGCEDIPLATATATETSSTPSMNAVETASADADADGICDDVDPAWEHSTLAGSATAPATSTSAAVKTSHGRLRLRRKPARRPRELRRRLRGRRRRDGICDDVDALRGSTRRLAESATDLAPSTTAVVEDIPSWRLRLRRKPARRPRQLRRRLRQPTPTAMASATTWTPALGA